MDFDLVEPHCCICETNDVLSVAVSILLTDQDAVSLAVSMRNGAAIPQSVYGLVLTLYNRQWLYHLISICHADKQSNRDSIFMIHDE